MFYFYKLVEEQEIKKLYLIFTWENLEALIGLLAEQSSLFPNKCKLPFPITIAPSDMASIVTSSKDTIPLFIINPVEIQSISNRKKMSDLQLCLFNSLEKQGNADRVMTQLTDNNMG